MTDPALFDLDHRTSATPRPAGPAPTGGLPAHVRAHLDAIGALNHDGIDLTVRPRRCPDCHAEVLVGLDGPVLARTVIADAIEVDELGEALAIAARRARWWIGSFPRGRRGSTYQFVPRDLEHIGKPFRGPVFIAHACWAPPPPARESRFPRPVRARPVRARPVTDTPDF